MARCKASGLITRREGLNWRLPAENQARQRPELLDVFERREAGY